MEKLYNKIIYFALYVILGLLHILSVTNTLNSFNYFLKTPTNTLSVLFSLLSMGYVIRISWALRDIKVAITNAIIIVSILSYYAFLCPYSLLVEWAINTTCIMLIISLLHIIGVMVFMKTSVMSIHK